MITKHDMIEVLNTTNEVLRASGLSEELWASAVAPMVAAQLQSKNNAGEEKSALVTQTLHDVAASPDWAERLGRRLRIDAEPLLEIFELSDDGELQLIIQPSRLPAQRAPASRAIALLLAGARQAAGIDDGWTATAVIREACRNFGVFDTANFASEIASMDAFAVKGSRQSREVKVTARGFEELSETVSRLVG